MFERYKMVIPSLTVIMLALLAACQPAPPAAPPVPPSPEALAPATPTPPVAPPPEVPVPATPAPPAAPPPEVPAPATPAGYVVPEVVDSFEVSFNSGNFKITGYLSRPKTSGPFPGLIIIHENRGLNNHIKDVARRYANQGYAVLALDLLSRVGGTAQFANPDEAVAAIGTLSSEGVIQDLNSGFAYLQSLPFVNKDRIGVLGYCWGGGNSLLFATRNSSLKAAVVYYGPNPANMDAVANITAPMLGVYGADDTRITVNVPALEQTMIKYNRTFEYKIYPGAAHAFFNDTGTRYNREASFDAWERTIAFLEKHLKN